MKRLRILLITGPAVALACGPWFYPAPPTLDHYPERLPVKTMRELLKEASPPPADAASFGQLSDETEAIADDIGKKPAKELIPRINALLKRNRAGDYRKRFANCLFDFRDLLTASNPSAEEAAAYAKWRVGRMEFDDGTISELPKKSYRYGDDEFDKMLADWRSELDSTGKQIAAEVEKASPALKPHWLVQAGAWQFKHANFEQAAALFQQVIDGFPQHPRAEAARLMLARVRTEEWRAAKLEAGDAKPESLGQKMQAAYDAFNAYTTAYPQGRYAPDVPGWKAGLAREDGQINEAITLFLQQVDMTDHPEVVRRAVRECEETLRLLDAETIEGSLADEGLNRATVAIPVQEIARRPIAALAVVYHFLDSESRQDFDGLLARVESMSDRDVTERELLPMLRLRRTGREILPALAAAVADHKELYGAKGWRPRYLAILGWAASECGEHKHALRLCDLAGADLAKSDDLLFLRAVALQRDRDLDGALAAFRKFNAAFPESPLTRETQFRIATVLRDNHEAGLAAVELVKMKKTDEERRNANAPEEDENGTAPPDPVPNLHLPSELDQWIDTLLQFAPLAELQRGLSVPELDEDFAERLRTMIRRRYVAREEFTAAKKFAEAKKDEPPPEDRSKGGPFEAVPEKWAELTDKLARLTAESSAATTPAQKAEKLFQLAELWAENRGELALISAGATIGAGDTDTADAWETRERNARVLGLSPTAIARELEGRDELHHAYGYYLQAADLAPAGSDLAARCLWRANDALRRMAEISPWCERRAFQADASTISRHLHERLLRECPKSAEAKQSAWWTFPPPAELHWMTGNGPFWEVEAGLADTFAGRKGEKFESPELGTDYHEIEQRLTNLAATAATLDAAKTIEELQAIRRDLMPVAVTAGADRLINHLDDLSLLCRQPGLSSTVRAKYFAARLAEGPPDLTDPEMQPALDFLTFLALVREGGERPMSERMQEFLKKFPKSPKREAALARLAIATVRESHGHMGASDSEWPDSPILGGYVELSAGGEEYEPQRVFGALDAYDREFPKGRYAADVRLWRGVASIDTKDWKTAVNLLVATLDDATKRDLHLDASLNLAHVFMRLLEPEDRPGIIAALRVNLAAQKRLQQFMHSETLGARLGCLEGFLEEQFAHK